MYVGKKMSKTNVSQRHHIKGSSEGTSSQRKTPQPAAGAHMRWHVHSRRKGHLKKKGGKKEGKSVGCFLGLFFWSFFFGGPSEDVGRGPWAGKNKSTWHRRTPPCIC
jgi:hypothetical protein